MNEPFSIRSTTRQLVAATALAVTCSSVVAGPPQVISDLETAVLPSYCKDTQTWPGGTGDVGMARGKAIFGEAFWHFHHYCYALIYMMRADRYGISDMERRGYVESAIDDIEYVVKYLPAGHFMLPEMHTNRAKMLRRQGKTNEAIDYLRKAIEQNPRYWPAYSEMARSYDAQGDRKSAIETLRAGLNVIPDSKVLSNYLRELERRGPAASKPAAKVASRGAR
jgi:tetratricopeptide (TPR) repeat protein